MCACFCSQTILQWDEDAMHKHTGGLSYEESLGVPAYLREECMAYNFAIAAGRAHRGASWLPITIFPEISGPGDPGCPLAFRADTTVKQAVRVIYQKLAQLKGCTPADLCASRLWTGARNLSFQPPSMLLSKAMQSSPIPLQVSLSLSLSLALSLALSWT